MCLSHDGGGGGVVGDCVMSYWWLELMVHCVCLKVRVHFENLVRFTGSLRGSFISALLNLLAKLSLSGTGFDTDAFVMVKPCICVSRKCTAILVRLCFVLFTMMGGSSES